MFSWCNLDLKNCIASFHIKMKRVCSIRSDGLFSSSVRENRINCNRFNSDRMCLLLFYKKKTVFPPFGQSCLFEYLGYMRYIKCTDINIYYITLFKKKKFIRPSFSGRNYVCVTIYVLRRTANQRICTNVTIKIQSSSRIVISAHGLSCVSYDFTLFEYSLISFILRWNAPRIYL